MAVALACTVSCQEETLGVFGEEHYVNFVEDQTKEYRFSFATAAPDLTEHTINIPVEYIGRKIESDLEYKVEVIAAGELKTTASPSSYSVERTVFHKDSFTDTLKVVLKKTDELTEEKRLAVSIEDNDNFKRGPQKNCIAVIYFSNILTKPAWWDATIERTYLGEYSDLKYQHFILATGVTDLGEYGTMETKAIVATFVYYLRDLSEKGTPVYEADGQTEMLATVPYNNFV